MGKLHEVLAVETGLKQAADKVIKEAISTFTDKRGHFLGQHRNYQNLFEGGLTFADEHKELDSTVKEKIDYVFEHVVRGLDATYQKEKTNTKAKSDLVVDGNIIAKDVPATFLLNLETRLAEVRAMFEAAPTLDPGRKWSKDTQRDNVWVSDDTETLKTEKVTEALVLYPHTDKHPAQVDKISRDKVVGKWIAKQWSGALSVTEKSKLLGKIDNLLREVKKARVRANDTEIEKVEIGQALVDYLTK